MIYFDNAATTIKKPECVRNAVFEAMGSLGNCGRGAHEGSLSAGRNIFQARKKLCTFFGGDTPNNLVFTANATESLNIAIKGILNPGDHVITTAMEHNSVLRPLYEMEKQGVDLTILSLDELGRISVEEFKKAINEQTKAIVMTHASNVTGNVNDIKLIGEIAKAHGVLFVVDASQSAGTRKIDVKECNIDILCFTGHKGLLGPQGTGGLYVRPDVHVKPLLSGGSGIHSFLKEHPADMPTALEAGTLNGHGIAGLSAAIDYIESLTIDKIKEKEIALMKAFYQGVKNIPGVILYGDYEDPEHGPIVSLNLGKEDSSYLSDILAEEYGVATRAGAHCAPLVHEAFGTEKQGMIRFSFSYENTMEEVEEVIAILRELSEEFIDE